MKDKHYIILSLALACLFAVCLSVFFFFMGLSEHSYEIGIWYEDLLIYSSAIQLFLTIIILFKQKWGLFHYTIIVVSTHTIIYIYDLRRPLFFTSFHIMIVICLWLIFSEIKKQKQLKKSDKSFY